MASQLARFTSHRVDLSKNVIGEPAPLVEKGDGGYADWVIVAVHCLREYLDQPYRRLLDILQEMPGIVAKLGLSVDELPDFTTVCTQKQDLEMRIWRVLLRLTARLHESGEVQVVDSTSLAQRTSSHNYAKRVEDTFESVKTTLLVDCDSGAIIDVHCVMTLPHDMQIAMQLLTRNLHQLETVVADKGFDWTHSATDYGKKASDR